MVFTTLGAGRWGYGHLAPPPGEDQFPVLSFGCRLTVTLWPLIRGEPAVRWTENCLYPVSHGHSPHRSSSCHSLPGLEAPYTTQPMNVFSRKHLVSHGN